MCPYICNLICNIICNLISNESLKNGQLEENDVLAKELEVFNDITCNTDFYRFRHTIRIIIIIIQNNIYSVSEFFLNILYVI